MHDFFHRLFTIYPIKTIRLLEILPPLFSLSLISLPFWGAFIFPNQLAYFVIFFDVYWFYKSLNLAVCSFVAARRIKEAEKIDWLAKAKEIHGFSSIGHVVIIPSYKESIEKLKQTIDTLKFQTFPLKRIYVFVGFEKREEIDASYKEKALDKEFKDVFGKLQFTYHPDLVGEVKGKSSNQAYVARQAYRILVEEEKLSIDSLTVSSVDADSIFDPQYFSYLTFRFLRSEDPYYRFWQSANVNYNNFWQVPSFTRINAFFGSLFRTSLLVQGIRLIPNSTYSLSFRLLKEIDFWDADVIPEDFRIFFKAFFRTLGRVNVEPLYIKTSMDAPLAKNYFSSLVNKYHQERRWSWGISDDAIYLKWYLTVKNVPFIKKTYLVFSVLFDHILWPVNWFLITISSNVIVLLNPVFYRTTLGYNLPRLSGFILTLCLFSLFLLIFIDYTLQPASTIKGKKARHFLFPLEFIFMPVAGFLLSSFPALVSHIQLIRGKRLEYRVTEKV